MYTYQSLKDKSIQFKIKNPVPRITQKLLRLKNVRQDRKNKLDEKEGLKGIKLQKLGESSSSGAFLKVIWSPVSNDKVVPVMWSNSPILIDEEANKGKKLVIK